MTNEQKATQIAGNNLVRYYEQGSSYEECYQSALQAMQWKDEQNKQEKQQLIDEACKWLFVNDSYAVPTNVQVDRLREHLNKMKGE